MDVLIKRLSDARTQQKWNAATHDAYRRDDNNASLPARHGTKCFFPLGPNLLLLLLPVVLG